MTNCINYLFDIDGTLTPPRGCMVADFRREFASWVDKQRKAGNNVWFVTGSDRDKTVQQVGLPLWRFVNGCYQCCGNQLYVRGKLIKQSNWAMSANLHLDILNELEKSQWYGKYGGNVEERVGMVNISTIGRGCPTGVRNIYYKWDNENLEREKIAGVLKYKYPDIDVSIGGEISIDIYAKGRNKSQVLNDMVGETIFFGDRCEEGGNDYEISRGVDKYYHVGGWEETRNIIAKSL